jgi:hypothetical protein
MKMPIHTLFSALFLLLICNACSTAGPCTAGGDVSWSPSINGDKRCLQARSADGKIHNQGKYQEFYHSTGTLALDGEFDEGKKTGIWLYYAEDKSLIAVKYFDHGIESTPPIEIQKQINLLIQQKAGMRK